MIIIYVHLLFMYRPFPFSKQMVQTKIKRRPLHFSQQVKCPRGGLSLQDLVTSLRYTGFLADVFISSPLTVLSPLCTFSKHLLGCGCP